MVNAVSLIKRLIAVRSLHSAAINLRHEIGILETKISDHPNKSFETIVTPSERKPLTYTERPQEVYYSLPSFHGHPMKWSVFWEQFSSAVHNNDQLHNTQKLTYLREAITDPKVTPLLFRATTTSGHYKELVTLLKERYNQKRLIHRTHAKSIVDAPALKQGHHEELCTFVDNLKHSISSLKDCGHYSIETFLTSVLSGKLNKRLQESWLKYSRGVKGVKSVPDVTLLIRFLEEQLSYTPVAFFPLIKADVKVDATKRNKAPVHQVVPKREFKNSCQLCGRDRHPIYLSQHTRL